MENITHTMVGAVVARLGGPRVAPLAGAAAMIGANIPDIDVLSIPFGAYASIAFRRGWTHGPLALIALTFLVTGGLLLWDRTVRRRRQPDAPPANARALLLWTAIGVLTHPLLDWLNTYGIRLLMPFSDRWFYGDAVFIVDVYWWVLLGATLIAARRGASLRTVRAFATVVLVYPLSQIAVSNYGESRAAQAAAAQGITGVTEVMYQPTPLNRLAADLIVVTEQGYHLGTLRWLPRPSLITFDSLIPRGDWTDPRVVSARADSDAQYYLIWSRFPFAQTLGASVQFGDARFPPGSFAGTLTGLRVALPTP